MGFLIAFLALFLLLLVALAFASFKLFAVRDAQGRVTAPGIGLGCITGAALAFIGVVGLIVFSIGAFTISTAHSIEHVVSSVPSFKVRAWRADGRASVHHSPDHPVHVVLEWRGHSEPTEWLVREIGKLDPQAEILVHVEYKTVPSDDESGTGADEEVTIVDLAFPASEHDLQELDELLREHLPEYSTSQGVEIDIVSVYEDKLR